MLLSMPVPPASAGAADQGGRNQSSVVVTSTTWPYCSNIE